MAPKRRTKDKHLPPRVYFNHGRYFFVDKNNKWHNLGKTPTEMAIEWAKLFEVSDSNYRTMNEVFDRYMAEIVPMKAHATQKCNHQAMPYLRGYFGNMRPEEITPVDIYRYQDLRAKKAPIRANREKSLLSHSFSLAIKWGVIRSNPCKEVKRLPETPRDRDIIWGEYWSFWNFVPPLFRLLMHFAYGTALRRTDILKIKWSDISSEGIRVPISKEKNRSQKVHVYKFDAYSKELVSKIPKRGFYLFSNQDGKQYTSSGINTMWYRYMQKALKSGILTETFQFRDIRALASKEVIKEQGIENATTRLGHSNSKTTRKHYNRGATEFYMRQPVSTEVSSDGIYRSTTA